MAMRDCVSILAIVQGASDCQNFADSHSRFHIPWQALLPMFCPATRLNLPFIARTGTSRRKDACIPNGTDRQRTSGPTSQWPYAGWHLEWGDVEPSHLSDGRNPESRLLEHEQLPVGGEISPLRF
jgi:hypothetical protein